MPAWWLESRRTEMATRAMLRIASFAFTLLMSGMAVTSASAQLAQQPADKYIAAMDRPDRVLRIDEVIEKLKLKPGDIVADIGAGSGVFSIPIAKAIAPNGILYAVDIDQQMLDFVAA